MNTILRPGDTFIDVGANLGLVSLHGARIVGNSGLVIAFEPNPEVRKRLESHINTSRSPVKVDSRALGDTEGEFQLSVIGANTGSGTLGVVPGQLRERVRSTYRVSVVAGDEVPALAEATGRMLVKVDAEGFEYRVLLGLRHTVEVHRPVIVTEVNPFALKMNGSSPRQLTVHMKSLGYEGYELEAVRLSFLRNGPRLIAMRPPARPGLRDIVWTHPEGPWRNDLERLIWAHERIN